MLTSSSAITWAMKALIVLAIPSANDESLGPTPPSGRSSVCT